MNRMISSPQLLGRSNNTSSLVRKMVLVTMAVLFHSLITLNRSSPIMTTAGTFAFPLQQQQEIPDTATSIPVFYNVYVANQSDFDRVQALVNVQLSYLQSYHHPIYVNTIGYDGRVISILPDNNNMTTSIMLGHHRNASELVTLQSLWDYCHDHPNQRVVYLHSKGSYHNSVENDIMRQLLTIGALSEECAVHTDNIVSNVCSYRFSPFPHPHTPGNMWLAHCSYVNNLMGPFTFYDQMNVVEDKLVWKHDTHPSCVGNGRFAAEHWIHSHPNAKPSDVYDNSNFAWGYDGLREYRDGDLSDWQLAPRFPIDDWPIGCDYSDLSHRLKEYRLLYNNNNNSNGTVPTEDWWGWNFWLGPSDQPHQPMPAWKKRKKARQRKERQQQQQKLEEKKNSNSSKEVEMIEVVIKDVHRQRDEPQIY